MAHKNNDMLANKQTHHDLNAPAAFDELDEDVTTQISRERLAKALDNDVTGDPAQVEVIDAKLSADVNATDDDAVAIGSLLKKRFEIVERVHSSAMGHVYKAVDHHRHPEGFGEIHVAIKMMRRSIATQREAGLALEREAAKAQSLSHPNIINIFDFDQHNGHFFLVMEWLEGESVNSLLRRTRGERIPSRNAWNVLIGAASAVQHAHSRNIVHADINPSNIFVTDTGDVKLLDFGVARFIDDSVGFGNGQFAWATRTYASPQILSGLTPTVADDVFSLGCVAFRLLCGKHPFDGAPSLMAMQKNVTLQRVDGLSENDWRVLTRTLAFERSDRADSVDIFLQDEVRPNGALSAHAVSVRRPDVIEVFDAQTHAPRWTDETKRIGLVALAAVILVSGGLWLMLQQNGNNVPSSVASGDQQPLTADTPSAADALVAAAAQAVANGQFVTSTGDDARTLFRYAVAMDPDNAAALRGLRTISDEFVQRANEALRVRDISGAYAAIEIATESDPGNPAIAITNQLIAAQGDSILANARLAAAAGVVKTATEQLSLAEQFRHIDENSIAAVWQQISQLDSEGLLLNGIATAETHISAGNLVSPGRANAYAVLVRLRESHPDDPRLLATMEHLGERLLTRAAFATAAKKFDDAAEMLESVDSLGVLSAEVAMARSALRVSESESEKEEAAASAALIEVPPAEAPAATPAVAAADDSTGLAVTPIAMNELTAAAGRLVSTIPLDAETSAATGNEVLAAELPMQINSSDAPEQSQPLGIGDVAFTRYVAPQFPRRAMRRDVSGFVDVEFSINTDGTTDAIEVLRATPDSVFEASAVNAVEQWRFEQLDDVARVSVRLRFELPP